METKHTKGEWALRNPIAEYNAYSNMWCCAIQYGEDIGQMIFGKTKEEAEANAKLIAAAPELLEALIEVVRISDRKHDAWDKAKQAINKATK